MSLFPLLAGAACGFFLAGCAADDAGSTPPPDRAGAGLQSAHFLLKKVP
jgi:hypothetical protein